MKEHPLRGRCAGIGIIVTGPDCLHIPVGVGEIHHVPVRRESQAVGRVDKVQMTADAVIGIKPVEAAAAFWRRTIIAHSSRPEAAMRVGGAVIETIPLEMRFRRRDALFLAAGRVEQVKTAFRRHHKPSGGAARDAADLLANLETVISSARRIIAMDQSRTYIDPPEPGVIHVPYRALAQPRTARNNTIDGYRHGKSP